jgi:hypothetical protein
MPALAFLSVAGLILVALLFVADATLEKNGSPVIVTSQSIGLQEPPRHSILTTVPAPAPDMTSQAVLATQPKPEPEVLPKIHAEVRAARAEAPSRDKSVRQPIGYRQNHYRENQNFDRFSIKGQ